MTKEWTTQVKISSRQSNIIDYYRHFFNNKIPDDRQYWTLCGECVSNKNLKKGSEPDQMIKSGLISANQFFGVEIDDQIYKINSSCKSCNFLHGELFNKILQAHNNQTFNPSIINCDFLATHLTQMPILIKILHLLSNHEKYYDILISANFARKVRQFKIEEDELIKAINSWDEPYSLSFLSKKFDSSGRTFQFAHQQSNICSSYKNGPTTMSTFNIIIKRKSK
jgi:hypothetical protein